MDNIHTYDHTCTPPSSDTINQSRGRGGDMVPGEPPLSPSSSSSQPRAPAATRAALMASLLLPPAQERAVSPP